jgi:hypothetical protein
MAIHDDAKLPTDAQRRNLSNMLYFAFLEIRVLGLKGKSAQAADLADAFHNLPLGMWSDSFSLRFFCDCFLQSYQQKYPEHPTNYVAMLDEIIAMQV